MRELINRIAAWMNRNAANSIFERMTRHDRMASFMIKDDIGGIATFSFVSKEHLKEVIEMLTDQYNEW